MVRATVTASSSSHRSPEPRDLAVETNVTVQEESSDESGNDSDSVDSMGDIETIKPRKRQAQETEDAGSKRGSLTKYVPPAGMLPANIDASFKNSPFEYEKLASNSRLQLWAIRAPLDFAPSRLTHLSFTSANGVKGTLNYKTSSYTLSAAAESSTARTVVDAEGRQPTAGASAADSADMTTMSRETEGGEEMSGGMRLLVPDTKRGGKLFIAPRRITRHLLLTPDDENPPNQNSTLPAYLSDSVANTSIPTGGAPGKRAQPEHLLKFRNRAYGFDTPGPKATQLQPMDIDRPNIDTPPEKKRKTSSKNKASPKKTKS